MARITRKFLNGGEWHRGGRGGIRTLEAFYRLPAFQASALGQLCDPSTMRIGRSAVRAPGAERAGFEPAVAQHHTAFREQHLKPLGHLSARDCTKTSATLQERRLGNQGKKKPPQWAAVVRLAGFEPAAFGSATQRSIP
jgi:hypothetical protein